MRARFLFTAIIVSLVCLAPALRLTAGAAPEQTALGSISGTVLDNDTGAPLEGVEVWVHSSAGLFVGSGTVSADGIYSVTGLSPGTYYAHTINGLGYINEVWNDHICFYMCSITTLGDPIVISASSTLDHTIDFDLVMGTRVELTVEDDVAHEPIPGIGVDFYDATGHYQRSAWMDTDGTNVIDGVPPGTYYAVAWNSRPEYVSGFWLGELWQDHPCPFDCDPTTGSPIIITPLQVSTDVTFALHEGGGIFGHVNNALTSAPLANVTLQIFSQAGGPRLGSVRTDADGNYTFPGVPFGTYFLATGPTNGYHDELFDDHPCPHGTCTVTSGDPVAVTIGSPNQSASFSLEPGSSITGTVRDVVGPVLANVSVRAFDLLGKRVGSATTNASGVYTIGGLASGTYFVSTSNTLGYIDELANNKPCPFASCNILTGQPITVTPGAAAAVNFDLDRGGMLTGSVTETGGTPITDAYVQVYDNHGAFVTGALTPGTGMYLFDGLPAGVYFATTWTASRYQDELWNDRPCQGWCLVTAGSPLFVAPGPATTANFVLQTGASISGRVTDATKGTGAEGVTVVAYDDAGNMRGNVSTDVNGDYTLGGLAAGTYHVRTSTRTYLNEVWNDRPCLGLCGATAGTPIVVAAGANVPHIDFDLELAGRIQGTVIDDATSGAIGRATVQVFDAGGNLLRSVTGGTDGTFTLDGLPTGTFFVTASGVAGYIPELYDGEPYATFTDVTLGTGIDVTAGSDVTGITIALDRGRVIAGTVTRADTGMPAPAQIEVYDASARLFLSFQALGKYESPGLPDGSYFLEAVGQDGLIGMLFNEFPCPMSRCNVLSGTEVLLGADLGADAIADFALTPGGRIAGTLTPGGQSGDATVEVFDSVGPAAVATEKAQTSAYITAPGLPAGTYAAKAVSPGYGALVWLDVLCPGNTCIPFAVGNPITVTAGATTIADFTFIACPAIRVDPGVIPGATPGLAYTQVFTASGGTAPYAFQAIGRLPAGLALSAGGTLSGTVTAAGGWFRTTVRAADAYGCFGERSIYLPVEEAGPAPAPTVDSVDPAEGPEAGGTTVTLTGSGFVDGAIVTFGGTAAADVTFVSDTELTAVTPALGTQSLPRTVDGTSVDVTVTNPDKQSGTLTGGFTYMPPPPAPTIDSIDPESGPTAGGTAVTIYGTGFQDGAAVTFGTTPAAGVQWIDDATLEVTTPAHGAGQVDVVVTNPDTLDAVLVNGFTYVEPPTIAGIDPATGPATGGTSVTITGTGFVDGAVVTFGDVEAYDVLVTSSTEILATTPEWPGSVSRPRAPTAVDVVVTNPDGQSATLAGGFAYEGGPTVTAVSPDSGPESGNTLVTITGTDFVHGAIVYVGGVDATSVDVVNATTITARTPEGYGTVEITVENPDGQCGTLDEAFTYVPPPEPYYVDPYEGFRTGGTEVTISGANFTSGAQVFFDTSAATNVVVVDGETITARTPVHAPGPVNVKVQNADGQEGVLEEGFTYLDYPPDLRVSILSAPAGAGPGQTITIRDTTSNGGKGAAPITTTAFFLSADNTLDENDVWLDGREVPELLSLRSSSGATAVTIPDDTPPGTYFVIAMADAYEEAAEASEANNTLARQIKIGVNLLVTGLNAPAGSAPGESVTVTDVTRNAGPGRAPASTTYFYLSADTVPSADDASLGERGVPSLGPGQQNGGPTVVEMPDVPPGTYYILAVADGDETIPETSEADNIRSKSIRVGPDLTVTALRAPLTARPNTNVTVRPTTKNVGAGLAPASTTTVYWSIDAVWDAGDTELAEWSVPALNPGAVSVGAVPVTIPAGATPGVKYYLIAKADSGGVVAELSETNNTKAKIITVK